MYMYMSYGECIYGGGREKEGEREKGEETLFEREWVRGRKGERQTEGKRVKVRGTGVRG